MRVLVLSVQDPAAYRDEVSALTIEELYSSLCTSGDTAYLSSVLERIVLEEYRALRLLFDRRRGIARNSILWPLSPELTVESNPLLLNINPELASYTPTQRENWLALFRSKINYHVLSEVYLHDSEKLLEEREFDPDTKSDAYILCHNGKYVAHIWGWPSPSNLYDAIGIRASLENILSGAVKGIGKVLIDALVNHARREGYNKVIIAEPRGAMPKVLTGYGFDREGDDVSEADQESEMTEGDVWYAYDLSRFSTLPIPPYALASNTNSPNS